MATPLDGMICTPMVGDPCKVAVSRPVAANLRVARDTGGAVPVARSAIATPYPLRLFLKVMRARPKRFHTPAPECGIVSDVLSSPSETVGVGTESLSQNGLPGRLRPYHARLGDWPRPVCSRQLCTDRRPLGYISFHPVASPWMHFRLAARSSQITPA